jgi:hypothetical protein
MTRTWIWTLRALALPVLVVAVLHGLLGHGAELLLGVPVPQPAMSDAAMDSQNRFFGVAFGLYAVVLLAAAQDLPRYRVLLAWTLVLFFLAGCARLLSLALTGWPATPIAALTVVELGVPVVLGLWMRRLAPSVDSSGPAGPWRAPPPADHNLCDPAP